MEIHYCLSDDATTDATKMYYFYISNGSMVINGDTKWIKASTIEVCIIYIVYLLASPKVTLEL